MTKTELATNLIKRAKEIVGCKNKKQLKAIVKQIKEDLKINSIKDE